MLENLTAVALVITIAWLALIGYYIYLSQQQTKLEQELDSLKLLLEQKEAQE
ncbi:MAG: CcmD family protein [Anaerolineales bacterium]|nr:CcmD family protein [Anaerolineales bacterium]